MRLLVCDPVTVGCFHSSFNATFMEAIGTCDSVDSVSVLLEKGQLSVPAIRGALARIRVEVPGELPQAIEGKNRFAGLVRSLSCCWKVFRATRETRPDVVLFLAADNVFMPFLLRILQWRTWGPAYSFVVLHNNIENIKDSHLKRLLWRFGLRGNVCGIALASKVQSVAKQFFPSSDIRMIPHPTFQHVCLRNVLPMERQVRSDFLFLGRHSNALQDDTFTASFLRACSRSARGHVVTVAMEKNSVPSSTYANVNCVGYEFPMSDAEYWNGLRGARYVVIPPQAAHRLTASGVHADASSVGVPVVAPRGGAFDEHVPASCAGLVYKNRDIAAAVKHALSATGEEYKTMSRDVLTEVEHRSLECTRERLKELCKMIPVLPTERRAA